MRKLAWITVVFVYFLMVWGNLVSSTGSGLACPDWPLCHGTVAPPLSFAVVLEWGHRLLAFTATCLIVATVIRVFKSKGETALKKSGRSLLVLLAIQILLGGTTVLLGLSPAVSTIHLIVATLVFSGLITVACVSTWGNPVVKSATPKLKRLGIAGLVGLLVQLALGALVRHTHAGLACPNFPACLGSIWPTPWISETALAFFHRWWGILMLGLFVQIAIQTAKKTPELARAGRNLLAFGLAQVFLGIGTVLSGLSTHSRATHAAIGYMLWGILFYITLRAGGLSWLWKRQQA